MEATRDVMNCAQLDFMYAYTRARGIPFKQHTFVWGQQYPAWITTLTQAEQREEVEEWIAAFDTTNASSGTFTLADAIANTTGTGGGAVSLRKLGTNTLVLSNNHTYTGPTIVDGGTLTVTGPLGATAVSVNGGSLAGNGNFGGNVTIAAGATHSLAVAATTAGQDTSAITGTLAIAESTLNLSP